MLNIVIPMAGKGSRFTEAGYTFPKPLIPVNDKPMIEVVINNLKVDKIDHKFIFICQREHTEKYDLFNILKRATNNKFEIISIDGVTQGAACTVLTAIDHINNENDDLLIANSDQFVELEPHKFIEEGRKGDSDGLIMTFESTHPKWSFVRTDMEGYVLEAAEKRVLSNQATVGIYYFRKGQDFVHAALRMIEKDIRHNNEFYVCPVYNEMILNDKKIKVFDIKSSHMHGLGTPEDLNFFLRKLESKEIAL